MQLPERAALRCAAVGFFCDGNLTVSSFTGGLQIEPGSSKAIAPYGHVGVGLFHISADAVVEDVREDTEQFSSSWSDNAFGVVVCAGARARLGERWSLRAELRYTGFNYAPGTVHWASIIAPTLSLAGGF
jgi:opacity protein-like surface antigen